jgi:diguanylate cyclase (GGDEF)-like protein/PAS domain S-box-containing protein
MKPQKRRPIKWHRLYFALAAFDLITIAFGLYINHELITIYSNSVKENKIWAARLGDYANLSQEAGPLDAPGNDIFESRNEPYERKRFEKASKHFESHIAKIRIDITNEVPAKFAKDLEKDLDKVVFAYKDMSQESTAIFDFFAAKHPDIAANHMASMDRKYSKLILSIADLQGDIRKIQHDLFAHQVEVANSYRKYEYIIGFLMTMIVVSVAFYGHRISRAIQEAQLLQGRQVALRESEERFRSLLQNSSDIIAIFCEKGIIRYISPAVSSMLGFTPEEIKDHTGFSRVHPDDAALATEAFAYCIGQKNKQLQSEWRMQHREGSWRHFEVVLNHCLTEPGIEGILMTFRDVTERKSIEEQIRHQAFHDALTGLPNRALFMDRLDIAQKRILRDKNAIATLFLDLDNFKVINDSLGHEAGDRLLVAIAKRLQQCVRPGDTVARLGGDEFTVLLEGLAHLDEAQSVAERIVESLHKSFNLSIGEVFASASIGLVYTTEPTEPGDILRNADTAMYQAKAGGKAGYLLFDPSMNDQYAERLSIETNLRLALERDELRVHYQPLIDLKTEYLIGVEALARWQHPTKGLLMPATFIPIAEETDLIIPVGYWVMEEACRQAQEWRTRFPAHHAFIVNVNLSGKQLQRPDVVERVLEILAKTNLPPDALKLEITESVMMADRGNTVSKLQRLKAAGVKLAMDDFGVGYSSMARLSDYPIDTVKIDRAFISRLPDEEALSVVRAIITLSKALGFDVTGEGIETEDQLARLQGAGCDIGQGYYFARPLLKDAVDNLMATNRQLVIRAEKEREPEFIEEILRAA